MNLIDDRTDFDAFEKVLAEAVERSETRLLAYCLLLNHWHLLVWPRKEGHVYQGRFKSFPVQEDDPFYAVARYVERNALRANLVLRAEDFPWGSLNRWLNGAEDDKPILASWPSPRKASWVEHVNAPQTEAELAAIRRSVERGSPYGSESWNERTIRRLRLESTIRARGRPKKTPVERNNGS